MFLENMSSIFLIVIHLSVWKKSDRPTVDSLGYFDTEITKLSQFQNYIADIKYGSLRSHSYLCLKLTEFNSFVLYLRQFWPLLNEIHKKWL